MAACALIAPLVVMSAGCGSEHRADGAIIHEVAS
jgi:hypothetical protein